MVALPPRDDGAPLRLAGLDEILPRHLQRRLDRLRSAADQIDVIDPFGRVLDEPVGKALGGFAGEEGGVGVGEGVELPVQRRDHVGMAMAEAGHRRSAGGVEIAPAVRVEDLDARASDGDRHDGVRGAMQNVRHRITWLWGTVANNHPSRSGRAAKRRRM